MPSPFPQPAPLIRNSVPAHAEAGSARHAVTMAVTTTRCMRRARSLPKARHGATALVLDRDECPNRCVGPHLGGGVERKLDAPEALRCTERGSVEGVQRVAAVEVADPADTGVVVVRPVGIRAAHPADRDVFENRPGAEGG